MPSPPLAGYTIVTLAREFPGPYATLILNDLGADVIAVESPTGDPARKWSPLYDALNRGKKSVVLDLNSDFGRESFLKICAKADAVVEGFKPGTADRLGVGYSHVRQVRPDIIYVSISAFGQTGNHRDRPAHGLSIEAITGRLAKHAHSGYSDLDWSNHHFDNVADFAASSFAAIAIPCALIQRENTGKGCFVDISMADALMSYFTMHLMPALNGVSLELPTDPGRGLYGTKDGRVLCLSIAREDNFWERLCTALELGSETGRLKHSQRCEREDELRKHLRETFSSRTLDEWVQKLEPLNIPFAPVFTTSEVAEYQLHERGLAVEVPANEAHPYRWHIRQPLIFDGNKYGPTRHAPSLGADTEEILIWAAASEETSGSN